MTADKDGYKYYYDYENRLVKVTKSSGPEVTVAEYCYDALGRRIRKIDSIASQTVMYYYNNNWQVVTEADSAGDTARLFVYGNFIDEPVLMVDETGASAQRYYYVQDHLYSTAALVNNAGTVVERYEYDVYGKCQVLDADYSSDDDGISDVNNSYYYTGRELDVFDNGGLELQYNRNRYYANNTGRWLTKDPLGITPEGGEYNSFKVTFQYKDGLSLYGYVNSNPILLRDSYGLVGCSGGRWWSAGNSTVSNLVVVSVANSILKFVCKKAKLFSKYIYKDMNGSTVFEQKVYRVPIAFGRVYSCGLGPGIGGAHYLVTGDVSGVDNSDDFNWNLCGPSGNVCGGFVGGSITGSGKNGQRGGGINAGGLGVSLNLFGVSKTSLYADAWDVVSEALPKWVEKSYNNGLLERESHYVGSVEWVNSPIEAMPIPKFVGF